MRITRKVVEREFNILKGYCSDIADYSVIDGGIAGRITIGKIGSGGTISDITNFYTYKEFSCFLDGIKILNRINTTERRGIYWTVNDFKEVAKELDGNFDESKFSMALNKMIDRHDASEGITFETIKFYLEEYCLID
jgi:hypothetical protein